jgi:hypothetical protein
MKIDELKNACNIDSNHIENLKKILSNVYEKEVEYYGE